MTALLRTGSGLIAPAYVVLYVRTAGLWPLELVLVCTAVGASYLAFLLREPAFRRPAERPSWRGLATTTRESAGLVRRSPFLLMLFAATAFTGASSEGFDRLSEPWILSLIPTALAPVTALAALD